jgi:IrrE N-terminal-like domain
MITTFLEELYGELILPIPTDALTKLIERDAADLDLYADLSAEGADVEGVTDFYLDEKPRVRVARELSEQAWRENRLRTTLTHEYGHVRFHGELWALEHSSLELFPELAPKASPRCKRGGIINAPVTDWMEWQAGYVCGALLIPITPLKRLVAEYLERHSLYAPLKKGSPPAIALRDQVSVMFGVSREVATVRLLKLGYFTDGESGLALFR